MAQINGKRLRWEIDARGLTQGVFADRTHTSPNTVSRAINGLPVTTTTLRRFVSTLAAIPMLYDAAELLEQPAGDVE